jgi:hypothetical protein
VAAGRARPRGGEVDRGGRGRGAADAAAAAGLALAAVGPALWAPDRVIGDGVDLYGTVWFYAWIQRCLQTGADPGFTDLMFHPLGKDILAHTGNNFLDAILAAPMIGAVGLQRGITLTIALILWLNAMAMRAARVWTPGRRRSSLPRRRSIRRGRVRRPFRRP